MVYVLFTVLAGICWGCISLFIRPLAAYGFASIQMLFFRAFLSSFFLLVFFLIKDRKLLKIELKDIWMFIGTGVISLTFFSLCYFKTILEVGTSVAVVLLYTSPIFVLFMSFVLFKEKITKRKTFAIILTFAGCLLVSGVFEAGAKSITLKGFLIGICAGLGYALYSVFSRFALKKYNALTVTFYTFVFSSVSVLPFIHIENIFLLFNFNAVLLVCGIALICSTLPYIFYTTGLSGLETGKAAILVTVEPLVGTLIGCLVWKENLSLLMILGIVLIFASVTILELPEKRKKLL
ncbi:MAG: DMT family transporter [Treponemataceae bacterium]|nr:DMT family transporter [Treponemataceae bacterium]